MRCEEHQEQILLSVVGTLDPDEERMLRAHLAEGCPRCNGALAEAEATVSSLAASLPEVSPPESVRARLLERVQSGKERSAETSQLSASLPRPRVQKDSVQGLDRSVAAPSWSRGALAALLLFAMAVTGTTVHWYLSSELRTQQAEVARLREQVNKRKMKNSLLQGELEQAETLMEAVEVRQLKLVSLTATDAQPSSAWGRILWDTQRRRWYFRAMGMNPAAESRTYELWAVSEDEKISAGTFEVDSEGRALLVFDLPDSLGEVTLAAVTDEPRGGSPQPSGRYQLTGAVQ